jgi:hypothetical protein
MKKLIALTLVTIMILANIPIQAEEDAPTGLRGSMNRLWESGKILLGAVLLIPGCGFTGDGALKFRKLYGNTPENDTGEIRQAGFELGGGIGSLAIGIALMESGFRNLRVARRRKK